MCYGELTVAKRYAHIMETVTGEKVNIEILHDLLSTGAPKKAVAASMGITVRELNKTITELQTGQGLLLKYRELQNLQLTDIQAKILNAITPEKIESASLGELVNAFKTLKDKELVMTGKATSIQGIVGYLVQLEKEEAQKNSSLIPVNAEEVLHFNIAEQLGDGLPKL